MKNSRFLVLLILLVASSGLHAQQADISVHDPVMIKQGDTFYLFCTGWGISVFSSKDMITWKEENSVFGRNPPDWTGEVVPGFRGHMWAPDISFYNGKYYLYYSVSAFGKNTSAIGLATNVTLNPEDPNFEWKDQGMIIQSIPGRDSWNAIDPNLVTDDEGYPWLTFGSFWNGMKLVKLIPNRTKIEQPEEWYTIARRDRPAFAPDTQAGPAAIEAPFIFKKDTMFYLFVSWDYCCRGENSTYKVVVGRSDKVTGPYMDMEGKDMAAGGGSLVIEGDEGWAGVGHNSAYTFHGKDYLVFHAYDSQDEGRSKLKIAEISWTKNGWPVVDRSVLER